MPRIARITAAGFPHHIVHRGNHRENIFFDENDRFKYLKLLKKYAVKWESPILAYCLMTNHVHLLIRPEKEISLSKMMQGVALCYTLYANRKYKLTGRLWESRFYSSIIGEERYLWAVVRYIEQNPIRARITQRADTYPYSSAKAHLQNIRDEILGEELFNDWQRKEYAELLKVNASRDTQQIRVALRTESPFASEEFKKDWLKNRIDSL